MKRLSCVCFVVILVTCGTRAFAADPDTAVKHIQDGNGLIAQAVWVGNTLYVSGGTAPPVTPADQPKGTPAVYGDTKVQSMALFSRIEGRLKQEGLTMGDVVMMHVFVVADPDTGKPDFAGMNAAFATFFGTKEQPNKPARTTVQVAGLVAAGPLLEIEVIAAKSK